MHLGFFPYIINEKRSGVPARAAWEQISGSALTPRQALLNHLLSTTHRPWNNMCFDSFTVEAALEEMRASKPRVLYLALGETDHFAHEGRYDHYLHAAHRFDGTLRRIWETVQELPEYRDKTSLLISTDHGRGDPPTGWKSHSATIKGAEFIWIGAMGPRTPKLGMRANTSQPVTQSQVAATLAALVGEDFPADNRNAAPPIAELIQS